MQLPNYFLADLPPEASLSGPMIAEACQTLKRNREQYLQSRSTDSLVRTISELAASWLDPEFRFRQRALATPPETTGFSSPTLARGLDALFSQLTRENLELLLVQEFGDRRRLDELASTTLEQKTGRAAIARGPELLVQITAGNLPSSAVLSIVFGLLVRSAQFVKLAAGATLVPRLFAHSLYEVEPKLGACLELASWPGGRGDLEDPLFAEADCLTASGSDETLTSIRQRLPARVRFVGYGHRVSFGYITREVLGGAGTRQAAARAAQDVAAWNQLGCLSPHVFYVERGGRATPEDFAAMLADELAQLEMKEPRGPIPETAAAAIATRRGFYDIRAAHMPDTRQWRSSESTAWTVIFESLPSFPISCLYRFIYIKPVASMTECLQGADSVRGKVSTVGLEASGDRARDLAHELSRWGVTRICPLGQMQNPPLTWRHDGRPPLGDLISWTDWEQRSS
jgi:hypothetical protein